MVCSINSFFPSKTSWLKKGYDFVANKKNVEVCTLLAEEVK